MMMRRFLSRLHGDQSGSALIETAFVAPVLVLMSLGGVEVGNMVKRQHELQIAATKAAEIVMAAQPKDDAALNELMQDLAAQIEDDTGITTTVVDLSTDPDLTKDNAGYVIRRYRCGNSKTFKKSDGGCTDSTNAESFIRFLIREKYTPVWADFGIGQDLQFQIDKSVQIG